MRIDLNRKDPTMKALNARLHADHSAHVADALAFYEEKYNLASEYIDEKSEKWQDGEAGQKYAEWRDEIGTIVDALREANEAAEALSIAPEAAD